MGLKLRQIVNATLQQQVLSGSTPLSGHANPQIVLEKVRSGCNTTLVCFMICEATMSDLSSQSSGIVDQFLPVPSDVLSSATSHQSRQQVSVTPACPRNKEPHLTESHRPDDILEVFVANELHPMKRAELKEIETLSTDLCK